MADLQDRKGPRRHRVLIYFFAAALTVLIYWLLGFVVQDIGSLPGPSYPELETELLDKELVRRGESLSAEIEEVKRIIDYESRRQTRVRESTENSRQTMDLLLEVRRVAGQQDVAVSREEQEALAEAEQLFLANQKRYQELNDQLADLEERLEQLQDDEREAQESLEEARRPIRELFQEKLARHNLKMGGLKLSFLIPLLIVAGILFLRIRQSVYVWLVYALGIAVAAKVLAVIHEDFPRLYFKYILIAVAIGVVVQILVYLLRMVAHPKTSWLMKQYREAYESFLCPVCSYPIRRGPLKYLVWSPRSIRKLSVASSSASEEEGPYACPACTTRLYEKCDSCGAVRPSLLPACDKCGAIKALVEQRGPAAADAS